MRERKREKGNGEILTVYVIMDFRKTEFQMSKADTNSPVSIVLINIHIQAR